MALHAEVSEIPQSARSTRGQIVMNIYKGDRLTDVARIERTLPLEDVESEQERD
jgi:hypothetical protein